MQTMLRNILAQLSAKLLLDGHNRLPDGQHESERNALVHGTDDFGIMLPRLIDMDATANLPFVVVG